MGGGGTQLLVSGGSLFFVCGWGPRRPRRGGSMCALPWPVPLPLQVCSQMFWCEEGDVNGLPTPMALLTPDPPGAGADHVTSGATSDLRSATRLARHMVEDCGGSQGLLRLLRLCCACCACCVCSSRTSAHACLLGPMAVGKELPPSTLSFPFLPNPIRPRAVLCCAAPQA